MVVLDFYTWIAIISTVILIAVKLFLRYLRKDDDYWKKRGVPYDPRINTFTFIRMMSKKSMAEIILEQYRKQGKVHGTSQLGTLSLAVHDPELLKDILVKDFHIFHFRRDMKSGDDIADKMIISLKGEDWKRVRTIVTPVFTTKRLKIITSIMNECSQTVMDVFEKQLDKGGNVDVRRIFGAYTLDVIARAAFATQINSIEDPENIFVKKASDFFGNFTVTFFLAFFLLPTWISSKIPTPFRKSQEFFKSVILKVMEERKNKGQRYNDMLQLLTDATDEHLNNSEKIEDESDQYGSIINSEVTNIKYKRISRNELIAQCVLFFSVGYETTALTASYVAYALATNPEVQEKLVKEVDEAFENHNELNYDVVRDMKYLDCTVSETLRMYTPLGSIERTASEDYKLKDTGITIEKGICVVVPVYGMHMDPELFHEPEKFMPERFIKPSHHPYAFLPFGAGPRNCLGMRFALMEIKLLISNILRQYRFRAAETTKVPLEFKTGSVFLSVDKLPLKIEKRTDIKI